MSPSLILVIFLLLLSFGTIGCGILLKRIYVFTNGRWHRTREDVITERKTIPRSFVLSNIIPKIGPRPLLLPIAVDNTRNSKQSSISSRYHVHDVGFYFLHFGCSPDSSRRSARRLTAAPPNIVALGSSSATRRLLTRPQLSRYLNYISTNRRL